jgi:hypothetical protein
MCHSLLSFKAIRSFSSNLVRTSWNWKLPSTLYFSISYLLQYQCGGDQKDLQHVSLMETPVYQHNILKCCVKRFFLNYQTSLQVIAFHNVKQYASHEESKLVSNFMSLWLWLWRLLSFGMWQHVVWYIGTSDFNEPATSFVSLQGIKAVLLL